MLDVLVFSVSKDKCHDKGEGDDQYDKGGDGIDLNKQVEAMTAMRVATTVTPWLNVLQDMERVVSTMSAKHQPLIHDEDCEFDGNTNQSIIFKNLSLSIFLLLIV